ncbi:Glyoxalase superfamily enzyme, possibly 3-demethylubiquinone-9 3-methyltransferase [Chitinophaga sp. CF118]|uniref:VOC family protein n=1 Tax=Chitinophaga sp. CF118 TaxID=1884367 RepID=UPI0008F18286|nr:VOC family protein [Chitinophaga sp. CF118]SFD15190.1 Glyoxalase superfamily enzyme, possibly 3-demethylubiquinone-9 3-methyltransferase [Chitinophaga sp. CF118]
MNNFVYPCLTIKGKIAEAADFYINTFGEGKIGQTSPYVIQIELSGQKFLLLNEGPTSSPNASISFMVTCEKAEETEQYWNKLIDGGNIMMPLDSYGWSPKYGWVQDKYGVSWQVYTGSRTDTPQKFCPTLMFTGANAGKASSAVHFYTELFPQSNIKGILKYSEGEGDNPEFVKHAQFKIKDYVVMAMDSSAAHGFGFNDAISLVVECDTQAEIDKYWEQLTTNGGHEVACGWLTDKYGISWQIIPKVLMELVKDPNRAPRVMNALMQMKKLIIADLVNA